MLSTMKRLQVFFLLMPVAAMLACGYSGNDDSDESLMGSVAPASAPAPFPMDASEEGFALDDSAVAPKVAQAPAASAPPVLLQQSTATEGSSDPSLTVDETADASGDSLSSPEVATLVQQQRIIVRTVDMNIVVNDVADSVDSIGGIAVDMGGWLVSSSRPEGHRGFVSIRVPADRLGEAISRLRGMAQEIKSEITSSRDVTDEYYDIQARLTNLQATEGALIKLFDRAEEVEDALSIQQSLSGVREDIERLEGRIRLLEQTAAYSLINVNLELVKGEMIIDGGADKNAAVGESVRFRATFTPPPDIDHFTFTWDFGDGSHPVSSNRTAPTENESIRVTATITHVYSDERDSPYIAQIKISGFGETGEFEGEDTVIVTVSRAPVIEVFAGERFSIEAGDTVQFGGSFTRPSEIRDVEYIWDFGDGTEPEIGSAAEGVTSVTASHVYPNHRPYPYEARLTVTAQSDVGSVEASSVVHVFVSEPLGWTVGGWDLEEQARGAVRSLSAVGIGVTTFGIWFVIFSPVWVVLIVAVVLARRRMARSRKPSDDHLNTEHEPRPEESKQ